jgi:hypothetical protein
MEPSRCAMSEGLRRCSKMFRTVRGCSKVFKGIQGCSGVSPDNNSVIHLCATVMAYRKSVNNHVLCSRIKELGLIW